MNTAAISYRSYQPVYAAPSQTLAWAVVISVVLHLSAVLYLPNFQTDTTEPPLEVLNIQIEAPKAPEPVESPAIEQPPLPEPPQPKVVPKIEPKVIPVQKPTPIETFEPQTPAPQVVEEPVSPPVMSVAPATDATPVFTTPPPPPGPSQADLDAARRGYAERLARAIAQHKKYPRVAQMRGWQGEVLVDLKLNDNGAVLESRIERSSGYEILDKQALEMVSKAAPFPSPPDILKSSVFNIQVPVSFKLE